MKRTCLRLFLLMILAVGFSSAAYADSFTLTLLPSSGAVSGSAGSTVGWGYTITNQSTTNWLVLTGLNADPFLNGTPKTLCFITHEAAYITRWENMQKL